MRIMYIGKKGGMTYDAHPLLSKPYSFNKENDLTEVVENESDQQWFLSFPKTFCEVFFGLDVANVQQEEGSDEHGLDEGEEVNGEEEPEPGEDCLVCAFPQCNFEAKSKAGLQAHQRAKQHIMF